MNKAAIEIHALTPGRLPDFLTFFDNEAFADNSRWGFCFCQFMYVDHYKVNWNERTAAENRAAACDRICTGRMQGHLAYRDGKPVGWCNAAPRILLDAFEPDPDTAKFGHITCFIVAKDHRRTGVATALLESACAGLKAQGLQIVEASPLVEASGDAANHYGPLSMYLAAGFREHRRTEDGKIVVRRELV